MGSPVFRQSTGRTPQNTVHYRMGLLASWECCSSFVNRGQWSEPEHTLQECEHVRSVMRGVLDTNTSAARGLWDTAENP